MIKITNRQRKIKVDLSALRRDLTLLLEMLGYANFDIGLLITTNKSIQTYNREFRHKDKPTDILSFPFYPKLKAGDAIKATDPDECNLGDMLISAEYVWEQVGQDPQAFDARMQVLLVHGICHLLGYDHIQEADYKKMHTKELALLRRLR
jgi:rRNA maturation RNase YbeY